MYYEAQHHLLLLVKHKLYLLLAPPEQDAFEVRESEAQKSGEGGKGGGLVVNGMHHQDTIYDDNSYNKAWLTSSAIWFGPFSLLLKYYNVHRRL